MTSQDTPHPGLEALRDAVADARPDAETQHPRSGSAVVSETGKINPTAVAFNVFANLLETDGIRAALYSVLRLSKYRFISIFRFKDGKATSCVHVDRENLGVTQAGEVADTATYCCFVRNAERAFVTADATSDPRTAGHPARDAVRSYCGIPIFEPQGELIGTLCHYDLCPQDPEQLDLELLLQVSSALAQSGKVPPYPEVQAAVIG